LQRPETQRLDKIEDSQSSPKGSGGYTGMIVFAHLKESLDYYKLLEVAELEGDLLKAVAAGDTKKARTEYKKLAEATRIS
jgi:hypothetical protein